VIKINNLRTFVALLSIIDYVFWGTFLTINLCLGNIEALFSTLGGHLWEEGYSGDRGYSGDEKSGVTKMASTASNAIGQFTFHRTNWANSIWVTFTWRDIPTKTGHSLS